MGKRDQNEDGPIELHDVEAIAHGARVGAAVAEELGVDQQTVETARRVASVVHGGTKLAKGAAALGAATSAATGLTVAATSGAGIASGLAAAGAVVGGGMAAGPAVLAGAPAYVGAKAVNGLLFPASDDHSPDEAAARKAARTASTAGAAVGVAGVGAATVAGGASASAIMSTLAAVGGAVGGGAIAGTAILAAAPVAAAAGVGLGAYRLWGGKRQGKQTRKGKRRR